MSMKLILRTTNWKNQWPTILLPGEAGVPSVDHVAPTCKNKWQMLIFLSDRPARATRSRVSLRWPDE
ncbi:hypothetical protein PSCLAVI8L_10001 [Pseudoclavibacter sp. 8L]|nr:hypothetical protein PSCLAVI8L_10001 [Pseudoclavibacter sp. 8L]